MKAIRRSGLVALAAVSLVSAGCTQSLERIAGLLMGGQQDEDGTLTVLRTYLPDDIKSLDPAEAYDGISLDVVPSIFETLYQLDYLSSTYRVVPLLAADMPRVSADQKTLTIPLRRGIRFADDPCFKATLGKGRELTAEDFTYAMKRLALPSIQSDGWWLFESRITGLSEFREKLRAAPKEKLLETLHSGIIEGFKAKDPYTLVVQLKAPDARLLSLLTLSFLSAAPHEAVEAYAGSDGRWQDHPVGTGPFILTRREPGRFLVLDRNPDYHPDFYPTEGDPQFRNENLLTDSGKPLPFLDRIRIEVLPEPDFARQRFQRGKLDRILISNEYGSEVLLATGQVRESYRSKGYRASTGLGNRFYYLDINLKDPVLGADKRIRQALSHAIDRTELIQAWSGGRAIKMDHAVPKGIPDRPETTALTHDYDPAKARELLTSAGLTGSSEPPVLRLDLRGADSVSRRMGELLVKQFEAVGIKLNVQANTLPAFLEKLQKGETQIAFSAWGLDYPDAENVFQLLATKEPKGKPVISSEYDRLYRELARMPSGTERTRHAARLDEIIQEEAPWIYLFVQNTTELSQPWLTNLRTSELITNRYKYLRIDRDLRRKRLAEQPQD